MPTPKVGADRRTRARHPGSYRRVNDQRYNHLLSSLDRSIELFADMRTPDAVCVAAFDALKQARAKIDLAFENERRVFAARELAGSER